MNQKLKTPPAIVPGQWIGIFGGGQLGRMITHAGQRLGYHVAVFDPEPNCPAAQAADRHFMPSKVDDDAAAVATEMAQLCSVITLEFENIPVELVRTASRVTRVFPAADFLELCQDRISEKSQLTATGFETTPFRQVNSAEEVVAAADEFGWPLVLKTARSGYDGKGQAVIRSEADVAEAWTELQTTRAIAEKWIEYEAEVSMITARNMAGHIQSYPLFENDHVNHILSVTRCPVSNSLSGLNEEASQICRRIAETFGVIGLFCVEFFVDKSGKLLINEIAPRPHNCGHLTIEAFNCSQFEQQVRAICSLPLCEPQLIQPAAMVNLLGDLWQTDTPPNWVAAMQAPDTHLHLYGKAEARAGRKMGHLTVLDQSSSEAAITAKEVRDALITPRPDAEDA